VQKYCSVLFATQQDFSAYFQGAWSFATLSNIYFGTDECCQRLDQIFVISGCVRVTRWSPSK